jgi:hypothetical protein
LHTTFIAALFTIATLWKQSKCLEFYSAMRKNVAMWFEGKWTELKDIMVSEVSQAQKEKAECFLS